MKAPLLPPGKPLKCAGGRAWESQGDLILMCASQIGTGISFLSEVLTGKESFSCPSLFIALGM